MANDASTGTAKTTKTEKAVKGYHPCNCLTGTTKTCGGQTQGAFARGHDARMASRLATAVAEGKMDEAAAIADLREAGGGDLLQGKMTRSAALRRDKAEGKVAAKAEKKAKKDEVPEVAPGAALNVKVRVAHGKREFDAVTVRNATEQIVARHRFQGKNCDHPEYAAKGAEQNQGQ